MIIAMDLSGVDVDWVRAKLNEFVDQTPLALDTGDDCFGVGAGPSCGRSKAIELAEVVRPILRRLYPEWVSENPRDKNDEFKSERDAARRLLARLDHFDEVNTRLGGEDHSPRITASSLHHLIWKLAETLVDRPPA
jgi:hypothetical protein